MYAVVAQALALRFTQYLNFLKTWNTPAMYFGSVETETLLNLFTLIIIYTILKIVLLSMPKQ